MEENYKHINQDPDDNYPKPNIPADDSWAQMKDMLDNALPADETTVAVGKAALWSKFLKFFPALIVIAALTFWLINPDKTVINQSSEINKNRVTRPARSDVSVENHKERLEKENDKSIARKANPDNLDSISEDYNGKSTLKRSANDSTESATSTSFSAHPLHIEKKPTAKTNASVGTSSADNSRPENFNASTANVKNERNSNIKNDQNKIRNNRTKNNQTVNPERNLVPSNARQENDVFTERTKSVASTSQTKPTKSQNGFFRSNSTTNLLKNDKPAQDHLNNGLKVSFDNKMISVGFLTTKQISQENRLRKQFDLVATRKPNITTLPTPSSRKRGSLSFLKNTHVGLIWNPNLPLSRYDNFFTGMNLSKQYYNVLIPGVWVSKKVSKTSDILVRFNPYYQYFGNYKQITSSIIQLSDSTSQISATNLVKVSGMSGGIQYNQLIYNGLSVALGATAHWQKNAMLNNTLRWPTAQTALSDTIVSVKETSSEGRNLNLYFVTSNLEVFYSWNNFQLGAGIVVPISSMTKESETKIKPVSGQLVFRWRLK